LKALIIPNDKSLKAMGENGVGSRLAYRRIGTVGFNQSD